MAESLHDLRQRAYVVSDPSASAAIEAARPLSPARIDVVEIPDERDAWRAVAFLRPHFQLDDLSAPLRPILHLPTWSR